MRQLLLFLLLSPVFTTAQKKPISVEDIYKKGVFRAEYVPAVFAKSSPEPVIPADLKDEKGNDIGKAADIIYSETFPNIVLLRTNIESIYRRSTKADVFVYDSVTKKAVRVDAGKIMHPSLSPDGKKVAFVKENNLYIRDLATNTIKAVTTDGKWNYIINGNADWVYEEEFSFSKAFDWSPAGNYIAYYRFDETDVKEYNMTMYDDKYNKDYRYKYPKPGEANSKVEIHIYNVQTGTDVKAQYETGDIYIPRIKWSRDDNKLVVYWLNRHQDLLKLLATDAKTGASQAFYEEKNKYYVDINDEWFFLKDGRNILFTSEKDGYNHLYMQGLDGKNLTQVTRGNFEITEINGVDEVNKKIYYTVAYPRPMDRNFFVTDFNGKKTTQLTTGEGWHRIVMNKDYSQYYDYRTDINTPQVVTLNNISINKKKEVVTTPVRTVTESAAFKEKINGYITSKAEFIKVPNSKGDTLNGWMLKPADFDPGKKYPVLFCNYGGPGSQQVANRFGAVNFWHQMMAQKGFIIVSVDNTGTGFRGEEFKKKTYLQLGKLEIEDQIDAAKYIGSLGYVDKTKIGHWGWSYGGFMSSLAITKGADVFSAAVAVAPVTSWRYYDNIYTERYMRTPQENAKGYDDNSPINHTDKIKGKYLIIHGTGDDNVHFQNATQMITALVKSNIDFESAYYPNKNHGISGAADNTSFHLWNKMTKWITENLGNENTQKNSGSQQERKAF
jgi:dipeptidyl-peptidase-4